MHVYRGQVRGGHQSGMPRHHECIQGHKCGRKGGEVVLMSVAAVGPHHRNQAETVGETAGAGGYDT